MLRPCNNFNTTNNVFVEGALIAMCMPTVAVLRDSHEDLFGKHNVGTFQSPQRRVRSNKTFLADANTE